MKRSFSGPGFREIGVCTCMGDKLYVEALSICYLKFG